MNPDHLESVQQFSERKKDHIRLSLEDQNQSLDSDLSRLELVHEALPEIDLADVSLKTTAFVNSKSPINLETPLLISSMTAGHYDSLNLNQRLAEAADRRGWLMGVGSQRRELTDQAASKEWLDLRKKIPNVKIMGNLGLSQLIHTSVDDVKRLVDVLEPVGLFIHTNPLQEALQEEGTPHFKGGLQALEKLCADLDIPVVLKECGCGITEATFKKLNGIGLTAVDVSGRGGTHWGRIEGGRSAKGSKFETAAETFGDWGLSTVQSLLQAGQLELDYELWGSGGVRSGLDSAKLLALGARVVGLAKPILEAALESEAALDKVMERLEYELKIALFCTGSTNPSELGTKGCWQWKK